MSKLPFDIIFVGMFELIKTSQFSMIIILHRFKFECFFKSSQYIYIFVYMNLLHIFH